MRRLALEPELGLWVLWSLGTRTQRLACGCSGRLALEPRAQPVCVLSGRLAFAPRVPHDCICHVYWVHLPCILIAPAMCNDCTRAAGGTTARSRCMRSSGRPDRRAPRSTSTTRARRSIASLASSNRPSTSFAPSRAATMPTTTLPRLRSRVATTTRLEWRMATPRDAADDA